MFSLREILYYRDMFLRHGVREVSAFTYDGSLIKFLGLAPKEPILSCFGIKSNFWKLEAEIVKYTKKPIEKLNSETKDSEQCLTDFEKAAVILAKKPIEELRRETKKLEPDEDEQLITLNNLLKDLMVSYIIESYRYLISDVEPNAELGYEFGTRYANTLFNRTADLYRQNHKLQTQITVLEVELQKASVSLKLKTAENTTLIARIEKSEKEVERQLKLEQTSHTAEIGVTPKRETSLLQRGSTARLPRSRSVGRDRDPAKELVPHQKGLTELKSEASLEQQLVIYKSRLDMIARCANDEESTPEQRIAKIQTLLPPQITLGEFKKPLVRFSPSLTSTGSATSRLAAGSITSSRTAPPTSANVGLDTPSSTHLRGALRTSASSSSTSLSSVNLYSTSLSSTSSSASSSASSFSSAASSITSVSPAKRSIPLPIVTTPRPTGPS